MAEAYIVGGVRTPIGRYGGALSSARPDDLAAHVIREALARVASVPAEAIDEVVLGCANQAGEDNRNVARMAALLAGLPETVAGTTINRLCGSGLDAVGYAARAIRLGETEIMVAGGVESMSRAPFVMPKAEGPFQRSTEIHDTTIGWRFVNPVMKHQYGIDSMPETAENVAAEFSISREDQDGFALRSQARAAAAQKSGRFAREIAPYAIKGRKGETPLVEHDEHPRETTIEKLGSLPTPFRANGTVTAGNASGVNDGAAALILASAGAVRRYGLQPLARVDGMATAGVAPRIMGIGPVFSTRKLLERLGLGIGDIDIVELNEAFAAQALACMRQLGLADDAPHVNPNGGAIALGHPLGMSGARLALTAALELEAQGARRAIATMCIGVGQGISMLLARP
ncbi:3-oxoadipyl-CoA thiolase [Ensifer adhaerens]|uniref:3-oxoadipyl-CoA thiolase n=1 Tax=Ensifer adhaerens TaxID=106592 RepID=UPI001CBE0532|nr:3-oxoadipyl-CoA thiolase [Ensifer adhaerens]MBZ7924548.1 3-oxoadipyl-CoA thiolase [Ensifer adhaerens]UAX96215.1 3-oxoadipyl-CoA thiolase [Ensifer adhaerens]UAY04442.1 3-oxoadipyl-CoA thiolase [Ensifer adhaerens]UAY09874.1 3-oxoadipyl-CoA thiolase [Ensifer adhaerens]